MKKYDIDSKPRISDALGFDFNWTVDKFNFYMFFMPEEKRIEIDSEKDFIFLQSMKNNNMDLIKFILPYSNPNCKNYSALKYAIEIGNIEEIKFLIKFISLEKSKDFFSILKNGFEPSLVSLLKPNQDNYLYEKNTGIFWAIVNSKTKEFEQILNEKSKDFFKFPCDFETLLKKAIFKQKIDIVKILLNKIKDTKTSINFDYEIVYSLITLDSIFGQNLLSLTSIEKPFIDLIDAVKNNDIAMSNFQIENGVDGKSFDSIALNIATENKLDKMVEFLMPYSDPKHHQSYPFRVAYSNNDLKCQKHLIKVSDTETLSNYGFEINKKIRVDIE